MWTREIYIFFSFCTFVGRFLRNSVSETAMQHRSALVSSVEIGGRRSHTLAAGLSQILLCFYISFPVSLYFRIQSLHAVHCGNCWFL